MRLAVYSENIAFPHERPQVLIVDEKTRIHGYVHGSRPLAIGPVATGQHPGAGLPAGDSYRLAKQVVMFFALFLVAVIAAYSNWAIQFADDRFIGAFVLATALSFAFSLRRFINGRKSR